MLRIAIALTVWLFCAQSFANYEPPDLDGGCALWLTKLRDASVFTNQKNPRVSEAFSGDAGACGPACIVNAEQLIRYILKMGLLTKSESDQRVVRVYREIREMQDPALKTGTTSASYLDQIKKLGPALGIGFNVRARTVNAGDGNVARLQSDIYSPLLEILPHASVLFLAVADMGELLEDGQPRPVLTNGKSVGQHTAIGIPRIDDPSVIDLIDPQAPHWDGSSARIIPVTDANGVRTARLEGNGNSARFFKPFEDLRVRTFFAISGLRSLQPK